jgi:hypothetical protein
MTRINIEGGRNEMEKILRGAAQDSFSDEVANSAMKELRKNFDPTYMWCADCDGLVVKEKDCCMNRPVDDNDNISF